MKIFIRIHTFLFSMRFFIKNKKIEKIYFEDEENKIIYRSSSKNDFNKIQSLYYELSKHKFSLYQRALLFFNINLSSSILLVESKVDNKVEIVGMNYYYFNLKDIKENTIHEGFIGVLPKFNNQGIATKMRILSMAYFKEMELVAISTRIASNNIASLKSAKKVGFIVKDEYQNSPSTQTEYYMLNKLL